MATTRRGLKNDFAAAVTTDGRRISSALADAWSNGLEADGAFVGSWLQAGVLTAEMLTLQAVAGQIALDVVAGPDDWGGAVVGELGNELPVQQVGAVRITAAQGLAANSTRYIYRKQGRSTANDPSTAFVANTTGIRPANTIAIGGAVFNGTEATSVFYPDDRRNIGNASPQEVTLDPFIVICPPGEDRVLTVDFSAVGSFSGPYGVVVETDQDPTKTLVWELQSGKGPDTVCLAVQNASDAGAGLYSTSSDIQVTLTLQGFGLTLAGGTAADVGVSDFPGADALHLTPPDGVGGSGITAEAYGASVGNFPYYRGKRAGGTQTSPTATQAGQILQQIEGQSYASSGGFVASAYVRAVMRENATGTNRGAGWDFYATPLGAATAILCGSVDANGWRSPLLTLTDGATVTWNVDLGSVAEVTLAGNRTLAFGGTPYDGQKVRLRVRQDGTGSRTLTLPSVKYTTTVPAQPTLPTAANAVADYVFEYDATATKWRALGYTGDV